MHPSESASTFEAALTAAGMTVQQLDAAAALTQMEVFYRQVRAESCIMDEEGDTLHCQWGVNGRARKRPSSSSLPVISLSPGTRMKTA